MTKNAWLLLFLVLGLVSPLHAQDSDSLARFDGGIGVIPTGSANNIVRGINPAGQIWVIAELQADVSIDGGITVDGRGLLLGGGNNIGFNANASVIATLLCGAAAPFTVHSTLNPVPLEPNGDFRIDDVLDPVPAACVNPVLLIRNANPRPAGGGWFAAGIPKLD